MPKRACSHHASAPPAAIDPEKNGGAVGIGTALTADEKRAHLADIGRDHLVDQVCTQEILPPE